MSINVFQTVSVSALSPDGKYLAAGGHEGWIVIFDLASKKAVDTSVLFGYSF